MSYPLKGANAEIHALGSANFYSTYLAAITPASASVSVTNNGQDVTGLGAQAIAELPGLLSATATIGGFAGATPYIGNVCGVSNSGGTSAMYSVDIQSFDIALRCVASQEVTKFNSGTPPTVMSFMPDIIQMGATITAMVDNSTALTLPDLYSNTLNTFVLTYGATGVLTLSGNVKAMRVSTAKATKTMVQYTLGSSGTIANTGGLFGSHTFGGAVNQDPLWSQGGAAVGAASFYWIADGAKSLVFADSFWTGIRIVSRGPGLPVMTEMDLQATGAISVT